MEMFTDEQLKTLQQNLDGNRVKSRQQSGMTLSYLEGFDIIDVANTIFGYGNWSYSVGALEQVSEETNENQNRVIGYKAIVALKVENVTHQLHASREDVGFGTGIAKHYADAHESAAKEAVTDALKRAFRSFGNQFGNALYDKQMRNVDNANKAPQRHISQPPKLPSSDPYASLRSLGLSVEQNNGELIVLGQTYGKQSSIKKLGFIWDASRKLWHQSVQDAA